MTKEKWLDIYDSEMEKLQTNWVHNLTAPENWAMHKNLLINFIKNIDEATEVYNMENKGNN